MMMKYSIVISKKFFKWFIVPYGLKNICHHNEDDAHCHTVVIDNAISIESFISSNVNQSSSYVSSHVLANLNVLAINNKSAHNVNTI